MGQSLIPSSSMVLSGQDEVTVIINNAQLDGDQLNANDRRQPIAQPKEAFNKATSSPWIKSSSRKLLFLQIKIDQRRPNRVTNKKPRLSITNQKNQAYSNIIFQHSFSAFLLAQQWQSTHWCTTICIKTNNDCQAYILNFKGCSFQLATAISSFSFSSQEFTDREN